MFKNINILETASAMARHAAQRQSMVAENIANANTPGYKAKDLESFNEAFQRGAIDTNAPQSQRNFREETLNAKGIVSPNGNTVSIEDQMWRSAEASRDHNAATTIYSKALAMLRASVSGGQ